MQCVTCALALLLSVACTTKTSSSVSDSSVAVVSDSAGAVAAEATTSIENQGLIGPPDANKDSTYTYMHNHVRFGNKSLDDSAYDAEIPCESCKKTPVHMWIVPEKKAYKIDWPTALVNRENRGWITAEVVNVDNVRYEPLQLDPNEIAYEWVGPLNLEGTDHAVAFYKINLSTGESSGPMSPMRNATYCKNPDWKKRSHSAAKQTDPAGEECHAMTFPNPGTVAAAGTPLFPPNGTWISCVGGCCQVQSGTMKLATQTKGH